jgi:hypothetical protein
MQPYSDSLSFRLVNVIVSTQDPVLSDKILSTYPGFLPESAIEKALNVKPPLYTFSELDLRMLKLGPVSKHEVLLKLVFDQL